ncbi:MAG: DUF2868 domain-containing protein [Pseudomonadota bacterium]
MIDQLLDIQHFLLHDPTTGWHQKQQRDREIALRLGEVSSSKLDVVRQWWQQIDERGELPKTHAAMRRFFSTADVFTFFAGTLIGTLLASAVLHFDGRAPINILLATVLLVLLPLATLLLSLLAPLFKSSGVINALNMGRLVQSVVSSRHRGVFDIFSNSFLGAEPYVRWRIMWHAQLFGLAFSLAAIIVLVVKVTISDLAFAWGTTLEINEQIIIQLSKTIALPWAALFPASVPDAELVEISRFFRLNHVGDRLLAEQLTAWWPFLALNIIFYGVILRSLLLLLAWWQCGRSLESAFLRDPQITGLLDRMYTPIVSNSAEDVESPFIASKDNEIAAVDALTPALVVSWQGGIVPKSLHQSTKLSWSSESDVLADETQYQETLTNGGQVVIVTKSWEPPLLEFHDMLIALRQHLSGVTPIIILPATELGEQGVAADVAIWRESLSRMNDPHLTVQ